MIPQTARQTVRLRTMARKFRTSIPSGMAIPLPDKLVDSLSDEELEEFLTILKTFGLRQKTTYDGYGNWERSER